MSTTFTPEDWERRAELPLAAAALVFLGCYSWLVLEPGMAASTRRVLAAIDYVTWGLFVADYVIRVVLARRRLRYVARHLLDLLIVALPVLRPLRLLRLIALVRVLDRRAARSLQGQVAAYVGLATALVLYTGALAELAAERGAPRANIETFGTALWWAMTTITTVGYGDHYPVTGLGRLVAAALMVAGVALLGVVTGTLASWFVSRVKGGDGSAAVGRAELAAMREEVRQLTAELRAHRAGAAPSRGPARPEKPGEG